MRSFITVGYAQAARSGLWHEAGVLLTRYPYVLIATIGLGIMCLIGVISIRAIRRPGASRETWWLVHLYMYLALAFSFAHVIVLGPSFVGHPLTRAVWSLAWAGTAGLVLAYRFGLPVVRSLRHRLVVAEVRPGGPGRGVGHLLRGGGWTGCRWPGGQFLLWRFLTRGMLVAGPPLLAVGPAAASLPAADRQGRSATTPPPWPRLRAGDAGHGGGAATGRSPATRRAARGRAGGGRDRRHRPALPAGGPAPRTAPVVLLRASRPADLVLGTEVPDLVQSPPGAAAHAGRLAASRPASMSGRCAARARPAPPGRLRVRAGRVRGRRRAISPSASACRTKPSITRRSPSDHREHNHEAGSCGTWRRAPWPGSPACSACTHGPPRRRPGRGRRTAGAQPAKLRPSASRPAPARPPTASVAPGRAPAAAARPTTAPPGPWSSSATASSPSGSP